MRIDIADARSLSENHLLAMIIYELRKIEATKAIMKVPTKIGQNSSTTKDKNLNIAPTKEMSEATRRTVSVLNLPKR